MATDYDRYAGGAVNILLAAARSGASAVHAGAHGTGPNGDLIRSTLAAEGVVLSAPPIEDQDSGVCMVLLQPGGERTFVTTQMAERRITEESLATSAPGPGDLVCVSGYSLLGQTRDPLLGWLESLPGEVVVVLDPGDAFAGLESGVARRMLEITDVWTSNAEEGEALTGSGEMAEAAALALAWIGDGGVAVVRDGAQGCAVAHGDEVEVLAGYPQEAIDTNGAGDTHTGVLVAERAAGATWVDAARRANAAAAIKVTRRGPATAPTTSEIDAFLDAQVDQAEGSSRVE